LFRAQLRINFLHFEIEIELNCALNFDFAC
jgi:hypothetical protein